MQLRTSIGLGIMALAAYGFTLDSTDAFQADRGPEGRYRTTPLKGLWTHTKGGFYHDGRFATLLDVVNHYDSFLKLGLSEGEKGDLVEYLKSL